MHDVIDGEFKMLWTRPVRLAVGVRDGVIIQGPEDAIPSYHANVHVKEASTMLMRGRKAARRLRTGSLSKHRYPLSCSPVSMQII